MQNYVSLLLVNMHYVLMFQLLQLEPQILSYKKFNILFTIKVPINKNIYKELQSC